MKYTDRVYGEVEITEPVILELLNSKTLQRLKDIDQAGYFEPHYPGTAHTRFEHSIGVYLLLKKYNASLEEQIAGLIHDVSHSAFSHCIDYVLDSGSESEHSHQDNVFDEYVKNSEIPGILNEHGLNFEYILNDSNFPLKERDLPDLCADRIDYSLRTAVVFKEIENGAYFIDNLLADGTRWIFRDFKSAETYAQLFRKLNSDYYSGFPSAVMFRTVGDYLRHALAKKYITKNDLYTTDSVVLNKIKPYHKIDTKLKLLFDRMNKKVSTINDPGEYSAKVSCKSRVVDPLCQHNGNIVRVSDVKPEWRGIIERESKPKEYFLKFDR